VQVGEADATLAPRVRVGCGGRCGRRSPAGGAGEALRVLTVQQTGNFGFVTEHVSSFRIASTGQ
jgi:hypothetical protein